MARKNVTKPFKIASAQSLAASFFTAPMNVENLDNVGIIVDATNVTDNTGTFSVQVRFRVDTIITSPAQVSNWVTLTLDSTPTLADTDDAFAINLNQIDFTEVRLAFSPAGGTPDGVADVWFSARQVGG